jgi:hypothetical protein
MSARCAQGASCGSATISPERDRLQTVMAKHIYVCGQTSDQYSSRTEALVSGA